MKTLFKTSVIILVLLTAASCTQYRIFPYPFPDKEDTSTPYDVNTSEEFSDMLSSTGQVRLTADVTLNSFDLSTAEAASYSIDLNGHSLDIASAGYFSIPEGKTVTVSGGTFNTENQEATSTVNPSVILGENSHLILRNVNYGANETGLALGTDELSSTGASVTIENSTISVGGAYAISTNANAETTRNVTITLRNSTIKTLDADSAAVMINIPGRLIIDNCDISGGRQGVIVRGGTAIIENGTTITSRGEYINSNETKMYHLDGSWGSGNEVPYAALVVGNASTGSYDYKTSCTVDESTVISIDTTSLDEDKATAVYVASANNKDVILNISGDIKDDIISGVHFFGDNIYINSDPQNGGSPIRTAP